MKNLLLFISIPIVLIVGSKAQAQQSVITSKTPAGLVKVYSSVPEKPLTIYEYTDDAERTVAKQYLLDGDIYLFVQNNHTGNRLTAWIQKPISKEAHFLGSIDSDIQSEFKILLTGAMELKSKIVSGVYPLLYNKPKDLVLASTN